MGWIEPLALGNGMTINAIDVGSASALLLAVLSVLAVAGLGIVLALPRRRSGFSVTQFRAGDAALRATRLQLRWRS